MAIQTPVRDGCGAGGAGGWVAVWVVPAGGGDAGGTTRGG